MTPLHPRSRRMGPEAHPERGLRLLLVVSLAAGLAAATAPRSVTAQITLLERDGLELGVSGYGRTFTGVHDAGFDTPVFPPTTPPSRTTGFHSQVIRLKWHLEGDGWAADIHDRIQARVISAGEGSGPAVGFGVTTVPARLVNLETTLVDEPGIRVWHDVDRLNFSLYTPAADITIGRQAITWGVSSIFPVADLWARFSPFEMDTEEKPGIDAVRVLFYPADGLEMDAVLADRGSVDDLSAGIRGTLSLPSADVWAGAGKFWREMMVMGGATVLLDETKVRGEVVLPWSLDDESFLDPRVTFGTDWIRGSLVLSADYHFNGIGAGETAGYPRVLKDPSFARGETYYLGRHYLGGALSWSPDEENRLALALNTLVNLSDASATVTPVVGYDLGQAARFSIGGLLGLGAAPRFDRASAPRIQSEFGSYGSLLFTRLSLYF